MEQLTAKKPRPEVREFSLKNVSAEDLEIMESNSESFDPEADGAFLEGGEKEENRQRFFPPKPRVTTTTKRFKF